MRTANILTSLAVLLWLALLLLGRQLVAGIAAQKVAGFPNAGQINLYIVGPSLVVIALLTCALVCNALRRWPLIFGFVASAALLIFLPYFMVYGGGN